VSVWVLTRRNEVSCDLCREPKVVVSHNTFWRAMLLQQQQDMRMLRVAQSNRIYYALGLTPLHPRAHPPCLPPTTHAPQKSSPSSAAKGLGLSPSCKRLDFGVRRRSKSNNRACLISIETRPHRHHKQQGLRVGSVYSSSSSRYPALLLPLFLLDERLPRRLS
jgi:hypothetical protein